MVNVYVIEREQGKLVIIFSSQNYRKITNAKNNVVVRGGFLDQVTVLFLSDNDTEALTCNHEEADIRIILHAINVPRAGYERVLIVSLDTDVFILLINF